MSKNPLTMTIIIFAIGDGYTVWEAIVNGAVDVFTAIAWLQGIVLLIPRRNPWNWNWSP